MTTEELEDLYRYLVPAVREIYSRAPHSVQGVEYKELNDVATETDRYMEREIVRAIRQRYPDHRFTGEEYGTTQGSSTCEWLIDPIDGTVNFAAGIPMFGTSIALRENGNTVLGIIFDWPNGKIYHAIRGCGAFEGERQLHVSPKTSLRDSIATICLTSSYDEALTDRVLKIVGRLQPHVRGVRIVVCTVYELAWLAQGLTECMINIKPSIGVGSCAGKLIVTEAGGKVTNTKGAGRADIDDLLVSNGILHDSFLALVNPDAQGL